MTNWKKKSKKIEKKSKYIFENISLNCQRLCKNPFYKRFLKNSKNSEIQKYITKISL
jgi:hypothetical protein